VPDLSEEYLLANTRELFGVDGLAAVRFTRGADKEASAYRIVGSGHAYFLKVRRAPVTRGALLFQRAAADRVPEVIAPITGRDGELSQSFGEFQAILYPFVEGTDAFATALEDSQWCALGRAVRAIHEAPIAPEITRRLRIETLAPAWRVRARAHFARSADVRPKDESARRLLAKLRAHHDTVSRIVERAETLGERMCTKSLPTVVCHGDLHAGNVLVRRNGGIAIVDWDDPTFAARERDLMFIGGGVGDVWNRRHEVDAFYRGYGDICVDPEALAYYRYERIVEDTVLFCDELLASDGDHAERALTLHWFSGQFNAQGVVAMADEAYARLRARAAVCPKASASPSE